MTTEKEMRNHKRIVLAGDFNLDLSRVNDMNYKVRRLAGDFLQKVSELGLLITSYGDTFKRHVNGQKVTSELDWIVSDKTSKITKVDKIDCSMSDHSLIVWKLDLPDQDHLDPVRKFRNLSKINKSKFASDLSCQPWENLAGMSTTEEMATAFNNMFLGVLDVHAPMRISINKKKRIPKPTIALKKLRRQRDNARSKGNISNLRELRTKCNSLAKKERLEEINEILKKIQPLHGE